MQSPCLLLVAVCVLARPNLAWQLWSLRQILMSLLLQLLSAQKGLLQGGILIKAAGPWENSIVEMGGIRIRAARTYRGMAWHINLAMRTADLTVALPFKTCGLSGQEVHAVCVLSCFVQLSFSESAQSLRTSCSEQA